MSSQPTQPPVSQELATEQESASSPPSVAVQVVDRLVAKRFLTFHNLVEYALPPATLAVLVVCDLWVTGNLPSWVSFERFGKGLSFALAMLLVLLAAGWVMYLTKFYRLFWGYAERKKAFRLRMADLFPEACRGATEAQRIDVGRQVWANYWGVLPPADKDTALARHVEWVALVHMTNSVVLSVALLMILLGRQGVVDGWSSIPWLPWLVLVLHGPAFWYLRTAAIDRLENGDELMLAQIRAHRAVIRSALPSTWPGRHDA